MTTVGFPPLPPLEDYNGWADFQRAQPIVDLRGRDRRDHLPVEVFGEAREPRSQILDITLALAVRLFLGNDLLDQRRCRDAALARFQMRDVKIRRVFDSLSKCPQSIGALLRHDTQRSWKLGALAS